MNCLGSSVGSGLRGFGGFSNNYLGGQIPAPVLLVPYPINSSAMLLPYLPTPSHIHPSLLYTQSIGQTNQISNQNQISTPIINQSTNYQQLPTHLSTINNSSSPNRSSILSSPINYSTTTTPKTTPPTTPTQEKMLTLTNNNLNNINTTNTTTPTATITTTTTTATTTTTHTTPPTPTHTVVGNQKVKMRRKKEKIQTENSIDIHFRKSLGECWNNEQRDEQVNENDEKNKKNKKIEKNFRRRPRTVCVSQEVDRHFEMALGKSWHEMCAKRPKLNERNTWN